MIKHQIKTLCKSALVFLLALLLILPCGAENWYFKKTDDHTPPPCDTAQKEITKYGGYYLNEAAKNEKVIYLTFDAGYENGNVEKIVSVLEKHHAAGAFFVLKHFVTANPELVRRMDKAGCLICNHTASHKNMTNADKAAFTSELKTLEAACMNATGVAIAPFYRPPEGAYSIDNLQWAKELGYATVFWSFAYADWDNDRQPDAQKALKNLTDHAHNGEILLLHPTSATNAAILDTLLTEWENEGYRFGSLSELTAANAQKNGAKKP